MKVLLSWLNDFVDIDVDVNTLADKLVSAGFEIEEIINLSDNMKNVVVGKIEKITKHPNADKLKVCIVNVNSGENVQIITNAENVFEGAIVPVALHDSLLPTGERIKKGKLRGVESYGMFCSGQELCITEADYKGASINGILILSENEKIGDDMNNVLFNNDIILDVSVTSNRPDCNSIIGIAREIAAVLKKPFKMPNLSYNETSKKKSKDLINITRETDLCKRYIGSVVENIKITKSDKLIATRLRNIGMRPINNIVDITNYVLIETGQPMHAFDYDKIKGAKIVARQAKEKETITLLDGKSYELNENIVVIANEKEPMAVGGVMGGNDHSISNDTKTIVFECAKFLKENIRRTSLTIGVKTDSSFRFERGIDYLSQEIGMKRALHLIDKYGYGNILSGIVDSVDDYEKNNQLKISIKEIDKILGINVPIEKAKDILNSLQIITKIDGDNLLINPPEFRDDILSANDVAEEIIRLYGYEHITPTLLKDTEITLGGRNEAQKRIFNVKNMMVRNGYFETLTYSFTSPKMFETLNLNPDSELRNAITISNPLGLDLSIMRSTLVYSMLTTLSSNYKKGVKDGRFFEISKVYSPKDLNVADLQNETYMLSAGSYGANENFYEIKDIIMSIIRLYNNDISIERSKKEYLHPGVSIDISYENQYIGSLGEVHPLVMKELSIQDKFYVAEINMDLLEEIFKDNYKFQEISKFPAISRDIAIVVSESVSAKDILSTINKFGGKQLSDAKIFDIYRSSKLGDDIKSVAISLEFRAFDRTLKDDEINKKIDAILKGLEEQVGAQLR